MKKRITVLPPTFFPLVLVEILIGSFLVVLAVLLFLDLSKHVFTENILAFDRAVSETVYSIRSPFLTAIMLFVTFLGGNIALFVGSVGIFLFLLVKRYRQEALLFIFTFSTGVFLNLLLKYVVARARPEIAPLINEIFYSYPSGHSMNSFVFYSLLAYLFYHFSRNLTLSILVGLGCLFLILLIGVSRVYLGVHYPSDVVAGYLAGIGWLLTVLVVQRTLRMYRYLKKRT